MIRSALPQQEVPTQTRPIVSHWPASSNPLAFFAKHLTGAKAHIIEGQLKGLVTAIADGLVAFADVKARRADIDQKGGDALPWPPRLVSSKPVAAKTMAKSGMHGPEMKCLDPFRIQSAPSRRAFDFIPIASDPASGSVRAKSSRFSPLMQGFR
jgi:hypothetical protein